MRAISKNTRKATAITLAAALVIAVYLNWQYARTGVTLEEDAVNVSAVSQETVPVTDELMTEAEAVSSANKNYGEAQLVSVANNSGSKFFEEARLKRTKAHDEAMDSIQKALKSASLSTEEKKEYHIRDGIAGRLVHPLAKLIVGLMHARGVQQNILQGAAGHNAGDAGAGRLGFGGDNGHLLPHQTIGQAGFAHVRAADDRHEHR